MNEVKVFGLTKSFHKKKVVDDLNFEMKPGRVLGFLGPNGSGKTTTLKAMLGLISAQSGGATFDGVNYKQLRAPICKVGAVLENSIFHPSRKAIDHLRIHAAGAGIGKDKVHEVLEIVGLKEVSSKKVKSYSLGMRQRLFIATALLGDPGILLFDEPNNGLDPQGVAWLRNLIRRFASEGRSVLISSHQLAEVSQTVDDVVIISRGRLVHSSPIEDLEMKSTLTIKVTTPNLAELTTLLRQDNVAFVLNQNEFSVSGVTLDQLGSLMARNGIVVHQMTSSRANLEEVFLSLTEIEYGAK